LQQLLRLTEAFEKLATRRRQVLWMRKVEDIPQKEIAQKLGIAESTVEAHLVRAMRDLTKLFYGSEEAQDDQPRTKVQHETKHGQ
jgi:RNA polymerase sigma-70 factor (ECF subfamily)